MRVWIATGGLRREHATYHTDRDCSRLNNARRVVEKERSKLPEYAEECSICAGTMHEAHSHSGTRELMADLDTGDPEDYGLSPIGERAGGER